MTVFQLTESRQELFPYNRWVDQLDELAGRYQKGDPFPHIFLDNFHDEEVLRQVLKEFPSPQDKAWIKYRHFNENKPGLSKGSQFPQAIGKVIDDFHSPRFVDFLSRPGRRRHAPKRPGRLFKHACGLYHAPQKAALAKALQPHPLPQ